MKSCGTKLYHCLIVLCCFILLIVFGVVNYWLFFPYEVAKQTAPGRVLNKDIHVGDMLQVEWQYCKYIDIKPVAVHRQLIDDFIYPLPVPVVNLLPVGCHKTIVNVPLTIGDCKDCANHHFHLESTAVYQVNPIRTATVVMTSEEFTIQP